jgi:hypothetical protein
MHCFFEDQQMLKEVVDFLLIISKFYPDMFQQMVAILRGSWVPYKLPKWHSVLWACADYDLHTPVTQNATWVAYKALTTPWGWQPYAETCRSRIIWNILIIYPLLSQALLILDLSARREWVVSTTPRPLYPRERPILQEVGWAPGPVWTCAKNLAPTGIQSQDRPACSQSLYRLSYPAHRYIIIFIILWDHCHICGPALTKT